MKKLMILLCGFCIIFSQSLSCYAMSNKSAIDDIKYAIDIVRDRIGQ